MQEYEQRLNNFIASHLPLVVSMQAQIQSYDGEMLTLKMPLNVNRNDKGTGFGGSLYCLCVMNAIGLAFLKSYEYGLDPDLVVTKAEIEYKAPVKDDSIMAQSQIKESERWRNFFQEYEAKGKAFISLRSTIYQGKKEAVIFSGRFAIIGERDESQSI